MHEDIEGIGWNTIQGLETLVWFARAGYKWVLVQDGQEASARAEPAAQGAEAGGGAAAGGYYGQDRIKDLVRTHPSHRFLSLPPVILPTAWCGWSLHRDEAAGMPMLACSPACRVSLCWVRQHTAEPCCGSC